jgi:hypothetical protein
LDQGEEPQTSSDGKGQSQRGLQMTKVWIYVNWSPMEQHSALARRNHHYGWAMDPEKRFLPIEVVIVVAINLMVVAFGYHLYRLWDLFWN